ncbi:MAG: DNA-3-methyladenine glycosylase 2 family protein [Euzebyales bacterium]|nr:DNA-3-methyladenine glycosylase 2 family protein [Euzebyales bacterium]
MHTDFAACYRAVASRDARFDGRVYTAVETTRIYCRPSCPARTPLQHHVRFYAHPAAAERDGFRPCRRCRPEVSPDAPDWDVRADVAGRALRLIADGLIDDEGVASVAARLGVTPRHLHRLLVAEVGAGPLAIARSRRAQLARQLLERTDWPVTRVAFAAGFSSVRQFNDTLQAIYRCTPTRLRASRPADAGPDTLTLRLGYRPPLASQSLLAYLAPRAIPGVEEVVGGCYRRTVAQDGGAVVLELEAVPARRHVLLRLHSPDPRRLTRVAQRARRIFDLTADPSAVAEALGGDPLLGPLVASRPGLRVPGCYDGFELAVRAILGQQVSVAAATTTAGRLVAAFGKPLDAARTGVGPQRVPGGLTHTFPDAATLAAADVASIGMPSRRAAAVRALAAAVAEDRVVLDGTADPAMMQRRLARLPGIGPWTVAYVALRALRDPDAFPASDLGLLRAAGRYDPALEDQRALAARAEAWRPWRGYAALHLWTSSATAHATTDRQGPLS